MQKKPIIRNDCFEGIIKMINGFIRDRQERIKRFGYIFAMEHTLPRVYVYISMLISMWKGYKHTNLPSCSFYIFFNKAEIPDNIIGLGEMTNRRKMTKALKIIDLSKKISALNLLNSVSVSGFPWLSSNRYLVVFNWNEFRNAEIVFSRFFLTLMCKITAACQKVQCKI